MDTGITSTPSQSMMSTSSSPSIPTPIPTNPPRYLDTTTAVTPSWLLWQFLDSALPTGGFIASNGLEAFAKIHPSNTTPQEIEAYVNWSVHSAGYTNLPFVSAVWTLVDAWTAQDLGLKTEKGKQRAMQSVLRRIANLDREYDVFMNNAIQNAASRKQGDGIVMMGVKCFADQLKPVKKNRGGHTAYLGEMYEDEDMGSGELGPNIRILKPFKALLRSEETAGHYPIAFAMIARLLGFDLGKGERYYEYDKRYDMFFYMCLLTSLCGSIDSDDSVSPPALACPHSVVFSDPTGARGTLPSSAYHDPIAGQGQVH